MTLIAAVLIGAMVPGSVFMQLFCIGTIYFILLNISVWFRKTL